MEELTFRTSKFVVGTSNSNHPIMKLSSILDVKGIRHAIVNKPRALGAACGIAIRLEEENARIAIEVCVSIGLDITFHQLVNGSWLEYRLEPIPRKKEYS